MRMDKKTGIRAMFFLIAMMMIHGTACEHKHHSDVMVSPNEGRILVTTQDFSYERKSCNFTIADGYLSAPSCKEPHLIETVADKAVIGCSIIHKIRATGVMVIKGSRCDQVMIGEDMCSYSKDSADLETRTCDRPHNGFIWLLAVSNALISILFFVVIRYKYIRSYFRMRGYKINGISGGILKFDMILASEDKTDKAFMSKVTVSYVKSEKRPKNEKKSNGSNEPESKAIIGKPDPERRPNIRNITFTPYRLLKTIFFLTSWIRPGLSIQFNHAVYPYMSLLSVQSGQTIHLTNGTIIVDDASMESALSLDYYSTSYESKMRSDWYCAKAKCDDKGTCSLMSHYPSVVTKKIEQWESFPNRDVIVSRMCAHTDGSCAFSSSCWRWDLVLEFSKTNSYEVLSIGNQSPLVKARVSPNIPCIITSIKEERLISTEGKSVVKTPAGNHYLCPFRTSKMTPSWSTLGDLQYMPDGSYTFDFSGYKCGATWSYGPTCNAPIPFLPAGLNYCMKLPGVISDIRYSVINGFLKMERDSSFKLEMACKERFQFEINVLTCGTPKMSLWGIEGSGNPLKLVITNTENRLNSYTRYTLPCTGEIVSIPCDGSDHTFEMPSIKECKELSSISNIHVVDSKDMGLSLNKETGMMEMDRDDAPRSFLDSMFSTLGLSSMISSTTMIVIIIVVFLLVRR